MTLYDEVNLLMEKLTEAWGSICIACDKDRCEIGDGNSRFYLAPTLLEALRMAENDIETSRQKKMTEGWP